MGLRAVVFGEHRLQSQQGSPVAFSGGGRLDPEDMAHIAVRQVFEGPHEQHLAIGLGESSHRVADLPGEFPPAGLLAGCGAPRQQLGKLERGSIRQADFTADGPASRLHMLLAHAEQPFVGRSAQPDPERHRLASEIVAEPFEGLELRFLNHVRRIEAGTKPRIAPQFDHLAQLGPMPHEQPIKRPPVARASSTEELLRLGRVGRNFAHEWPLSYLPRKELKT